MSEIKDGGGAAFPRFVPDGHYNGSVDEQGMTLRDYFAGRAMEGLVAASGDGATNVCYDDDAVAKNAYALADAMLRARGAV